MRESLCWKCKNSCGKCPWTDTSFTPIEGWVAEKKQIKTSLPNHKKVYTDSYFVIECPLFIKDSQSSAYRIYEMAEKLNVCTRTISRMAKKGLIIKEGNYYYFKKDN